MFRIRTYINNIQRIHKKWYHELGDISKLGKNKRGPKGPKGERGERGEKGERGERGEKSESNNILSGYFDNITLAFINAYICDKEQHDSLMIGIGTLFFGPFVNIYLCFHMKPDDSKKVIEHLETKISDIEYMIQNKN